MALSTPRFPHPGETIPIGPAVSSPGGRAPAISANLAALGCRVFLLSCIGMDSAGNQVLADLRTAGVNVDFVERVEKNDTGSSHTLLDPSGNNARFVYPGAASAMSNTSLLAAKAMISSCQIIILIPDIPAETFSFAMVMADHFNIPIMCAATPTSAFPAEHLSNFDILIADKSETESLTGIYPGSLKAVNEAVNLLLRKGVGAPVIYLGKDGAATSLSLRNTKYHPPKSGVTAVSTEAEDAFAAAVAFKLTTGSSLHEAVSFGVAASVATAASPERRSPFTHAEILMDLAVNFK